MGILRKLREWRENEDGTLEGPSLNTEEIDSKNYLEDGEPLDIGVDTLDPTEAEEDAQAGEGSLAIGGGASADDDTLVVGNNSSSNRAGQLIMGNNSSAGSGANDAIVIGDDISAGAFTAPICIGTNARVSSAVHFGARSVLLPVVPGEVSDSDLDNEEAVFEIDENEDKLLVRAKYSDGTVKSGTIDLTE